MTDQPSKRDKIIAQIQAAQRMTVANGCTEDEAVAAADMVAKLLAKYNLTVDEVELRKSELARHTEHHEDEVGERLWKVAAGIAFLTDTKTWSSRRGVYPHQIDFFGFDHEVMIAKYLLAICARAMRQEHKRLKQIYGVLNPARQRLKILPFLDGMADSLHDRIRALKVAAPTGTGLMVVKDQLILAAMPVKLESISKRPSRNLDETYTLGVLAGQRVPLDPGVTQDGSAERKLLL